MNECPAVAGVNDFMNETEESNRRKAISRSRDCRRPIANVHENADAKERIDDKQCVG